MPKLGVLWGRNHSIKRACIFLLVTAAFLEIGLRFLLPENSPGLLFQMERVADFQALPWAEPWNREHDELRRTFQPYELYRLEEHKGELINVSPDGYRLTKNASAVSRAKIGIFGGSTLWGSFARDEHTIASELSLALNQTRPMDSAEVGNFGEVGFVFSQDLHRAIRLRYSGGPSRNDFPQTLIFFGGVNDALAAISNFVHGIDTPAGLPWENQKYRDLFRLGDTGEVAWSDFLWKFKTVRTFVNVFDLHLFHKWRAKGQQRPLRQEDYLRISDEVSEKYVHIMVSVNELLKNLELRVIFVLQPILAHKADKTSGEKQVFDKNIEWQNYLKLTFDKIRAEALQERHKAKFVDLSALFANTKQLMFYDAIHYSEEGNKVIGERLADALLR